jgi:flagellin-specific chaperone FliS
VPSPSSSPQAAGSEDRPTLSSQPANEYLRSYEAYINDFKSAYQAMKDGDVPRYQSVIRHALDLKAKSAKLGGELNAEEEQRFADYLNKKANELSQFASQNR